MPKRVLRVYANPYTYIDPEGRPAGVYSHDPAHLPGQQHVGIARLQTTVTEKRDPSKDTRPSLMDLVHHYDAEVQEIPYKPGDPGFKHYRDGLRDGSLIAADEATAKAAGLAFEDAGEVLGRARLKAVREWQDSHDGEPPAFASDDDAHAHVPAGLRGQDRPAPAPSPAGGDLTGSNEGAPQFGPPMLIAGDISGPATGQTVEAVSRSATRATTDDAPRDDAQATEKGNR